ncbi:competence type IV pilus major pilin ComGC [Paraliobacillus sediminis]|uniref:competence type IV pilus major pilin ComGC n=1 Tax=Paraliobacillus sediminis TaxID=1885916 RepID=UPI000E3E06CD|nr:type II secretion system protein [Paraliobacillus sediminis]
MLTRMKKMLRNEKGFTLVELLAVIVILGIIVAIAVPAIGNIIGDAEEDADEAQIELILDAARLADVQDEFTDGMDADDLVGLGYLEDNDELPEGTVSFDTDTNQYEYTP